MYSPGGCEFLFSSDRRGQEKNQISMPNPVGTYSTVSPRVHKFRFDLEKGKKNNSFVPNLIRCISSRKQSKYQCPASQAHTTNLQELIPSGSALEE
jgi:hypothetical protein